MFFAGLARGLNKSLTESRAEEAALAEREATRENTVLSALLQSDDPDIASAAMAGLLDQAAGRRPAKGLRRWFGEMAGNPALPRIRDLMAAGKQVTTTEAGPTRMPEGASAAMPAGSAVEPGGPPMSLAAVHNTLPQAPGYQVTRTVPRRPFLTPMERSRATQEAEMGGRLSAFRTGLREAETPQERQVVMGAAGIRPSMSGQYYGNIQDDAGNWYRQERVYDPELGGYTIERIPIAPPASMQVKTKDMEFPGPDGRPHVYRVAPDGTRIADLGVKSIKGTPITITHEDGSTETTFVTPTYARPGATPPPPAAVPTAAGGAAPPVAAAPPPAAPAGAPPAAASAAPRRGGIVTKPATVTPDQVIYFTDQIIRDPASLKTITGDKFLMSAVRKELATRGIDLTNLDAASRTMALTANDLLRWMPSLEAQARDLDRLGLMGPVGGRWRELLAGTIGAGELAGGNVENAEKIGQFKTLAELTKTALMRAHVGARGSGLMLTEFENTLGAGWRDLPTFIGGLKGARQVMEVYASRLPERGGPGITTPPSGGPAIGERRTVNGQEFEWDGAGWLPVTR